MSVMEDYFPVASLPLRVFDLTFTFPYSAFVNIYFMPSLYQFLSHINGSTPTPKPDSDFKCLGRITNLLYV